MCGWLSSLGHDAVHTLDLPHGNRTPDEALIERADLEQRILVTKDDDFVQSRLVRGRPRLPWLIGTGNVANRRLESMIRAALPAVQQAFEASCFIELGPDRLTIRE